MIENAIDTRARPHKRFSFADQRTDKGPVVQTKIRVVRGKVAAIVPPKDKARGRSAGAVDRGTGGARCQTIAMTRLPRERAVARRSMIDRSVRRVSNSV